MTGKLNSEEEQTSGRHAGWAGDAIFCVICAMFIGLFVWMTDPNSALDSTGSGAKDSYYNLLVQGFRAGHLYVNREAPPALAQLANPYDPAANAPYIAPVNDLSYFKGRLYLYFGVTPALVLFWPFVILTGHYLSEGAAVATFFAAGFAIALGLMRALCRRYFPEVNIWMLTAYMLAVDLTIGLTLSGSVYTIARVCGFAFAMLTLAAIWCALHARPKRRPLWLLLASLAYGLAVGSRPSLLFGVIILLIPVAQAWRESGSPWKVGLLFAAAIVPAMLIGFGLMLYNELRFGSPFEFGWHYQLNGNYDPTTARQFSLYYFWFNFRSYFLEPFGWSRHFPFLQSIPLPSLPSGYYTGMRDSNGGILSEYPMVLLALAVPLAWRNRPPPIACLLRWFIVAVFLLFMICVLTLCLFFAGGGSYELDFLSALMLLSIIGFLGLERMVSGFPVWRLIACSSWCLLLAYSILFNTLSNIESHVETYYFMGNSFYRNNRLDKAIVQYQKALKLWPDCADAHYGLGNALSISGRVAESIFQYQQALEIKPDYPEAANNLAYTLLKAGRAGEAINYFQKALEIQPSYQAYYNLACAYRQDGKAVEAVSACQKAIELQPQFLPAQIDLAWLLATWPEASIRNGSEAVALAEKANQLSGGENPRILRTLAAAYAETGRFPEATATAKQALVIATAQSRNALITELQTEIRLYQSNAPCRSTGD